ncbi:MAG: hypothetical protein R3324_14835, partial [Halobacteriales archaeon]|nr:hypothetical protein [Halobacteriales archaeon]
MTRGLDLDRLYQLLDTLEETVGGKRQVGECDGYMDWPDRGVYFFFAADERREDTDQLRLTRIGTHAVSTGSGTSLWDRLRTHRGYLSGSREGGGTHRGSVFRKAVGEALIDRHDLEARFPKWGVGSTAAKEVRRGELPLERRVSDYIREPPFLWIDVDNEPGPESDRAFVERNAIALVSNFEREPIDGRRDTWLGHH